MNQLERIEVKGMESGKKFNLSQNHVHEHHDTICGEISVSLSKITPVFEGGKVKSLKQDWWAFL